MTWTRPRRSGAPHSACRSPTRTPGGAGQYAEFGDAPGGLHVEIQKVQHPSRVHLDIEADDLDAGVARLQALGATRVVFVKRWWVMESPDGQHLCVVPLREEGGRGAPNRWH